MAFVHGIHLAVGVGIHHVAEVEQQVDAGQAHVQLGRFQKAQVFRAQQNRNGENRNLGQQKLGAAQRLAVFQELGQAGLSRAGQQVDALNVALVGVQEGIAAVQQHVVVGQHDVVVLPGVDVENFGRVQRRLQLPNQLILLGGGGIQHLHAHGVEVVHGLGEAQRGFARHGVGLHQALGEGAAVVHDFFGAVAQRGVLPAGALRRGGAGQGAAGVGEGGAAAVFGAGGLHALEENQVRDFADERAVPVQRYGAGRVEVILGVGLHFQLVDGPEWPLQRLAQLLRIQRKGILVEQLEAPENQDAVRAHPAFNLLAAKAGNSVARLAGPHDEAEGSLGFEGVVDGHHMGYEGRRVWG